MNKAASQYLREVKRRIHCSRSLKAEFLYQLEDEVNFFCEEHDGVDRTVLVQRFGEPGDVASDFLSEAYVSGMNRYHRAQQGILHVMGFFLFIVFVVAAGSVIYINYRQEQVFDGYYIETITYEGQLTTDVTGTTYINDFFDDEVDESKE